MLKFFYMFTEERDYHTTREEQEAREDANTQQAVAYVAMVDATLAPVAEKVVPITTAKRPSWRERQVQRAGRR
jgi:hypothetical protein